MKKLFLFILVLSANISIADDLSAFSKGWQSYIEKVKNSFKKGKHCDLAYLSISDAVKNATPDFNDPYDNVIVGCVVGIIAGKGTVNEKPVCRSTFFSVKHGGYSTGRNSIVNEIDGPCDNGGFYKLMNKPMGNSKDWNTGRWILSENYCKYSVFIYSGKLEYKNWLEDNSKKYFDQCQARKKLDTKK